MARSRTSWRARRSAVWNGRTITPDLGADADTWVIVRVDGDRYMATNLTIDPRLLEEALKAGNLKTKKDTVNEALREYVQRRKQAEILKLFCSVDFDPGYDHKKGRPRK